MGAAVIFLAVALRLWGNVQALNAAPLNPAAGSVLMYLETGREIRPQPITVPEEPVPTEPAALPVFSGEEAERVYIRGTGPEAVDVPALLETVLDLELTGDGPAVLIVHTHTTESYTMDGETYAESSAYRTLDPEYNMISVGDRLKELREAAGIGVIHAREIHDYPNYNGAYGRSRETIQAMLEEYPSIRLVLDLHRDAASDGNGGQFDSSARVEGKESAQVMLVLSTAYEGWSHSMNLAVKLTALLERTHPGVTRGILTRASLYNQDLGIPALLVEVGSAGNTRQEALVVVEALAQALVELSRGTALS
jgi:stage II sporulation protein P